MILLGVRLTLATYGKIVVLPLETYGDTEAASLGDSLAGSLAVELNRIRETYSTEHEEEMARLVQNSPLFARTLVMKPAVAVISQPRATKLTAIKVGPVTIPLDEVLFAISPKFNVTLIGGIVEHYDHRVRIQLRVTGPEVRRDVRSAFYASGESEGGMSVLIEEVAHQVVVGVWMAEDRRRWQGVQAFTAALRHHYEYLSTGDMTRFGPAEESYRRAIRIEPGWYRPRLNLASLLYSQLDEVQMLEALDLFRVAAVMNPDDVTAVTGQLNATVQILLRFPGKCARTRDAVSQLLSLRDRLAAWRITGKGLEGFNLHASKGNAGLAIGTLMYEEEQECQSVARPLLMQVHAEPTLREADQEYALAEAALRGKSVVVASRAKVHSLLANYYATVSRRAEAAEELRKAIEGKERIKNSVADTWIRGSLAEDYMQLEALSADPRELRLQKASRELEVMTLLYPNRMEATWAYLRWSEALLCLGDWQGGISKLIRAMAAQGATQVGKRLKSVVMTWKEGLPWIQPAERLELSMILKKLVDGRFGRRHVLALALLAEIEARDSDFQRARSYLMEAERGIRERQFPYRTDLAIKVKLSSAKIAARQGQREKAAKVFNDVAEDVRKGHVDLLLWDSIEILSALERYGESRSYLNSLLNDKSGTAKAEILKLCGEVIGGPTCSMDK